MKSALLSILSLLAPSSALPSPPSCPTLMYSTSFSALPPSFPGVVAHGVHSLTLPDIHTYFPTNKTDILLPVVNPDLLSLEPILYRPPSFQHTFSGPALRAVDQVLTHMNSPHRDMRLYTDLEKIVHAAHMQEVWLKAAKAYVQLQESNTVGEPLCRCIRDVENNGVIRMLRLIALKVREPGLMYGEHTGVTLEKSDSAKKINDWDGNLYKYNFVDTDDKTAEAVRKMNDEENMNNEQPNKNAKNDWSGNLYSYHFVDKDSETEKKIRMINGDEKESHYQRNPSGRNDWSGNLYSYHFVDKDENTEQKARMINGDGKKTPYQTNPTTKNDWSGNLYSYHFVDKDENTEMNVRKMTQDSKDKAQYLAPGDGDSVKPLPHLTSPQDWETWKSNMSTMEPHMEEYSSILALYMHCMLR